MSEDMLNKFVEIESSAKKMLADARLEAAHVDSRAKADISAVRDESSGRKARERNDILKRAAREAEAEIEKIRKDLSVSVKKMKGASEPRLAGAKDLVLKEMKRKLCL